eukprot:CAMPEP_0177602916 /NCGR_PEP_ID=MMETSP0419_2-20121207/15184_1 /TAXON_ID=582737 /ORGANISM="Tetraselmis sp., Strain GSL018" /LENGTH=286 /DNA_ID=CAMNT_0019096553 /DNA_START=582 /DNA_END=1442 /DNA_ORIENTATION=-
MASATVVENGSKKRFYPRVGAQNGVSGSQKLGVPNTQLQWRPEGYDVSTWKARVDLAACYQLLDDMGLNEGICNHLTVMVPGTTDRFLVVSYGMHWSEVKASNLLMVDDFGKVVEGEGEIDATAFFIHKALHKAGHVAVLHTHMPNATALCCTEDFKLHMCHQNCLRFYDDIVYDPVFNGLVTDDNEGERIAAAMGKKKVFMHASHGVIVCGPTVSMAFDDLYYLERAAQVQILAMSTGKPLRIIDDKTAKQFKDTCEEAGLDWANAHFEGAKRKMLGGPRHIFIQ